MCNLRKKRPAPINIDLNGRFTGVPVTPSQKGCLPACLPASEFKGVQNDGAECFGRRNFNPMFKWVTQNCRTFKEEEREGATKLRTEIVAIPPSSFPGRQGGDSK